MDIHETAGTNQAATEASPRAQLDPLIESAMRTWRNELVDLSARNNLLYFRDTKGSLALPSDLPGVGSLLSDGEVSLKDLLPEVPMSDYADRLRLVEGKVKEAAEERGLDVLFVTFGMASWPEPDSERKTRPQSPVVMLPVRLIRPSGAAMSTNISMEAHGEAHLNPALLRKLGKDFGLRIDADAINRELHGATTVDAVERTLDAFRNACTEVQGFEVSSNSVVGTFSYVKLPMIEDIERLAPGLTDHHLVSSLAGNEEARRKLLERNRAHEPSIDRPDYTPPMSEFLVLDADASQNHAINKVLAGHDLIIQGPPGTGKSQTIANLIASLIAANKTVLFVAEKRAAVDAVFRRLRSVGLGDLLLDMHNDAGQTRHGFAKDLSVASERLHYSGQVGDDPSHQDLIRSRTSLNEQTRALHSHRAPWGISLFDARARSAAIHGTDAETPYRFMRSQLESIDASKYQLAQKLLHDWHEVGARAFYATSSGWRGATIRGDEGPRHALEVLSRVENALLATQSAEKGLRRAAGLPRARTVRELRALLSLMKRGIDLGRVFDTSIFAEDLSSLAGTLREGSTSSYRRAHESIFSTEFRRAQRAARRHQKNPKTKLPLMELLRALDEAITLNAAWSSVSKTAPVLDIDSHAVERAYATLTDLEAALEVAEALSPRFRVSKWQFEQSIGAIGLLRKDIRGVRLSADIGTIEDRIAEIGLADILESIRKDELGRESTASRLEYVWLMSIVDEVTIAEHGAAGGHNMSDTVALFCSSDRAAIKSAPRRILRLAGQRIATLRDDHEDEIMLIHRQAKLKRRSRQLLPPREILAHARSTVGTIKPCWAMSPLVVSQRLPSEVNLFDVVIFDEASQVPPADAIPAIARGRQVVVAGDSKQLPPTNFFASVDQDEEEPISPHVGTGGYESILDALTGLIPERSLTWHYRSQDERLIAFSNAHIYDRSLTTFPGVAADGTLRHVLAELVPGDERTNSPSGEVQRVCDLILEHARERPKETLGVIGMGSEHANRIDEELRRRLQDEPDVAPFFDEASNEPFFVKNLERVQGDERDAIILSIGYGKEPSTGRLPHRFGPLMSDGGQRRLNVAVTRAKRRITLVSSFAYEDMDPERCKSPGVSMLRHYLAYAASGGKLSSTPEEDLPAELNPFEIQVRDALQKEGIPLTAQLGISGYRIDFALRDPDQLGRYVLAVECDGASYHSAPTARERDRLRQEQLERLGWQFYRIWSTDWFNDRRAVIADLVSVWRDACAKEDAQSAEPDDASRMERPIAT